MKLVIPPECQIGAMEVSIRFNDWVLHKMDVAAYINLKDQMIRLSHRKTDQEWLHLIHEALHGITDELGINFDGSTEAAINALSNGIVIFLDSLGIEPDFSQIPEEEL